jgi:hypothetical protein
VCRAEWGWPPPGYDVATLRSYDGRVYRGLCAKWRDRKNGVMPGAYTPCAPPNAVVSPAPQPELLPPPKLNGQK